MTTRTLHPEILVDRAADRQSYLLIGSFLIASWMVQATTAHTELLRAGPAGWQEPWLREFASHIALLAVSPLIPFMLSRAPVNHLSWRMTLPLHVLASLIFSAGHILLMVGFRKLTYPVLLGQTYTFDLNVAANWLYEYRKDAFTYVLYALGFAMNRALQQSKLETAEARREARTARRLTLKSGGRTILLEASDVIWARAAANYVEVHTETKTHLARMTLTALETLLVDAGSPHVRVHRSWIVNRDAVREIKPTGEGDITINLVSGEEIPGSRRYRHALEGVV